MISFIILKNKTNRFLIEHGATKSIEDLKGFSVFKLAERNPNK